MSMKEAIREHVANGSSVLIDGFTHLICFAAGHEIIRQERRDLTAIRLTPDLIYDQMVEAGCVKKLIFSWMGNPGVGSLHSIRRRIEGQLVPSLQLEEYSHFGLLMKITAASQGLPFAVVNNYSGSDIEKHADIRTIECPFTGKKLRALQALQPDVAIIHCQRSDREGNAHVWGIIGSQKEAAFSAKKVIVVAEEIVSTSDIRRDPNRTLIPGLVVHAVVHEPWGAHPSYAQGFYDRDNRFYEAWEKISKDQALFKNYLETFVFGVSDRKQYLERLEQGVLQKLAARVQMSSGVNYGY